MEIYVRLRYNLVLRGYGRQWLGSAILSLGVWLAGCDRRQRSEER